MSSKGGLIPGKDGGAHTDSHENFQIKLESQNIDNYIVENRFHNVKRHCSTLSPIQDGDPTGVHVVCTKVEPIFLPTESLPGISDVVMEACMETDSSHVVDLGSFDNGSGDWFDSKTKNGNMDFDISTSPPQSGDLDIAQNKDIPIIADIFGSNDIDVDVNVLNSVASNPINDPGVITRRPLVTCLSTRSRPISNHSQSSIHSSLSSQDRACLEELERGSQLSQEEKELIEDHQKELQDFDFHQLGSDQSGSLITPVDLDGLPGSRELVFDEVIDSGEPAIKQEMVTDLDTFVVDAVQSLADYNLHELAASSSSPPSIHNLGTSTTQGIDDQPSLATVSISTDKNTNLTQILVQTSQGQQIIHINTADLTQACTSTIQPMIVPTGDGDQQTYQRLPTDDAIIKDGLLFIPVNQETNATTTTLPGEEGVVLSLSSQDEELADGLLKDGDSGKIWCCPEPGCNRIFKKPSKLKIHQMRHTGERPFKCDAPGCDWAFVTAYKLKRHQESHQGQKDFICSSEGCGRKFTTIYNLNTHKKLHVRPCTEVCPQDGCDAVFATKRKLDMHMKIHGYEKKYRCPIEGCDKTFYSPNCMGSHARVHQHEHNLVCETCGKKFDKLCRLKQHVRMHTGEKPYPCTFEGCGWRFANASKLKRHIRKHTGERQFHCPHEGCGKSFMRSEHLRGHVITHAGDKPFVCPIEGCEARFTAKSSLYVHMKKHVHTDEKINYHCPIEGCLKKYSSKASLRSHIGKHFSNVDDASIWPMLQTLEGEELETNTMESLQQAAEVATATQAVASGGSAAINSVFPNMSGQVVINPAEYIQSAVESKQPVSSTSVLQSDVLSQHVGSNVVTQLIGTEVDQLPEHDFVVSATSAQDFVVSTASTEDFVVPMSANQELVVPVTKTLVPTNYTQVESSPMEVGPFSSLSDDQIGNMPQPCEELGSARTDFLNNQLYSDLAKKRRVLMKEAGGTLGVISLQEMKKRDFVTSSFLTSPTSTTSTSDSMTSVFNPSDLLSSQALTFRDPETGVTYVQTQLLQDDPPHPDLYGGDIHLGDGDDSSLVDDLSVSDQGLIGTTINLQDLA